MKPNEIKKELEYAMKIGDAPIGKYFGCIISKLTAKETLAYIEQLEAQIERLNIPILTCKDVDFSEEDLIKKLKETPIQIIPYDESQIRVEAIKEFVKQAEKKRTVAIHCDVYEEVVRLEDLKEMVGDN